MRQEDWSIIDTLFSNKSISITAEKLYLTQPALTRRLKKIEGELDVVLVNRSTKGITFTPEGKLLAAHARRMIHEYTSIQRKLNKMKNEVSGTIQIAISNSLAQYMLPDLLFRYKQKNPRVDFEVITGYSSEMVRLVYNREVQIGFVRGDHTANLQQHLISTDAAYIVSSTPIDLQRLPQMPRIDFYADIPSQMIIENWWYEFTTEAPYIAMRLKSGNTCFEMIRRGLGYGVFLTDCFFSGGVGEVFTEKMFYKDGSPVVRNNWMIYREELQDDLQLKLFRTFCEEYFSSEGQ